LKFWAIFYFCLYKKVKERLVNNSEDSKNPSSFSFFFFISPSFHFFSDTMGKPCGNAKRGGHEPIQLRDQADLTAIADSAATGKNLKTCFWGF